MDAKVVKVIESYGDPCQVVINKGSDDGVREGDEFLVYALGEDLVDPDTGEPLGQLELVRGRGRVKHIQPKVTTLESSQTRVETRRLPPFGPLRVAEEYTERVTVPFDKPAVGDLVRRVRRALV